MYSSNLEKIIKRLQAMALDHSNNRQKRIFEQFGIPLCEVTYIRSSREFILPQLKFLIAYMILNILFKLKFPIDVD